MRLSVSVLIRLLSTFLSLQSTSFQQFIKQAWDLPGKTGEPRVRERSNRYVTAV